METYKNGELERLFVSLKHEIGVAQNWIRDLKHVQEILNDA